MAPPDFPGLYYDETKKKYFKIQPNHVAPQNSRYSEDAVRKEAQGKLRQAEENKYAQRHRQTRIQHSTILQHPSSTRMAVLRYGTFRDFYRGSYSGVLSRPVLLDYSLFLAFSVVC